MLAVDEDKRARLKDIPELLEPLMAEKKDDWYRIKEDERLKKEEEER